MSELKCPYCNKTLHCGATLKSDEYLIDLYQCANSECESTEFLVGCKEFWDILGQLIRTRKALEIALNCLDYICKYIDCDYICGDVVKAKAKETLEQITALEQKD